MYVPTIRYVGENSKCPLFLDIPSDSLQGGSNYKKPQASEHSQAFQFHAYKC